MSYELMQSRKSIRNFYFLIPNSKRANTHNS